ncbi:MAG: gluconate kinase [Phenylobacterium zucineum]|nr:MAG: gluconate kinase [Phenylobacterium zucineum]
MDAEEARIARWFADRADLVIETACARVYLTGAAAYKIKKRVDLGYLDYSTLDLRHWALERELRFNRAAASDIYRAVRKVTASPDGYVLDGSGQAVEYLLEMRRFDETAVLAARPWAVDGPLADALGREVANLHAMAELRPNGGGGAALKFTIDSNAKLLRELKPRLGADFVETVIAATDEVCFRQAPLLDARQTAGFARHCHADLHLGNILLEGGKPILFDCIEFNDILSDIDVQYDLAFLLMDLDFRRRRDAAVRVLSAYLDQAARTEPAGLYEGLSALPLMMSVRAAVRAHVQAHSGDDPAAIAYLTAALDHLTPVPASLTAVGGLSGTGKSSFARMIAPGLGAAPGAVVLRTDEIRKRVLGVDHLQSLAAATYTPDVYAQVYEILFAEAGRLIRAGRAVVLDATFIDASLRHRAEVVARATGVDFHGVWLEAPARILASRITDRQNDASDATVGTLEDQMRREIGEVTWSRIDATGPVIESAEAGYQN